MRVGLRELPPTPVSNRRCEMLEHAMHDGIVERGSGRCPLVHDRAAGGDGVPAGHTRDR